MTAHREALVAVRQYQSEIDAIREAPEPVAARWTIATLAAFVALAVCALFVARVDRVVNSSFGKLISTDATLVFQALDTSLIRSIDVREGDQVRKGQVLATLDATFASADVTQLRQQLAALDAQIARASAELAHGLPRFSTADDPEVVRAVAMQRALFEQRARQLAAQLTSFDGKIAQTRVTIAKLTNDTDRLQERERISKRVEGMRTTLAEKGAGSVLNQLASNDAHLELLRTMENSGSSLEEARHQLASLQADREASVQQWLATASQELVTATTTRDATVGQLEKANRHKDLVRIVAPDDAVLLTVAKLSVGSVLKEGDPLFTAAPLKAPLEAEVRIASRDVGFVRTGDHATLKIDAFSFTEHGFADGTVRWVSEGSFSTDDNGQAVEPFYKVRIGVDAMHFVEVPATMRLIPGMTMVADIKVGHRTLAGYILGTIGRGAGEAMREP